MKRHKRLLATDAHLGPEQAPAAHRALGSPPLLPAHWSAFVMGDHSWTEPGERLLAGATPADGLLLPTPGQRLDLIAAPDTCPTTQCWPETLFGIVSQVVVSAPACRVKPSSKRCIQP